MSDGVVKLGGASVDLSGGTSDAVRSRVGAVVIGRNEGPRLLRAIEALTPHVACVVYADSGSNDGSVEGARARGARVVSIASPPFTAARGRQEGFEELLRAMPGLQYVFFMDGDCIVDPAWMTRAAAFMDANVRAGAISGRRREEFPNASSYNELIDVDWDAAAGPADYPGGDSFCRVEAIRQIGGWSVDLIAGEDPDLGFRLRDAGWEVHRLADEMTLHDVRMTRFGQYWKRAVRAGYCYLEVGWKHRRGTGRWWLSRVRSSVLYAMVLPAIWLAGVAMAIVVTPWWMGVGVVSLVELVYARLLWVLYRRCRRQGMRGELAMRYAVLNVVCKWANAWGSLKYLLSRARGKRTSIIEYKGQTTSA